MSIPFSSKSTTMVWQCAVFHSVNESRRLAQARGEKSAARNGLLAEFIDQGFINLQALALRRLLEPPATNPNKQIISLRRILTDIRKHHELVTRENYVCHDGLPYDYKAGQQRRMDRHLDEMRRTGKSLFSSGIPTSGPEGYDTSERVHKQ